MRRAVISFALLPAIGFLAHVGFGEHEENNEAQTEPEAKMRSLWVKADGVALKKDGEVVGKLNRGDVVKGVTESRTRVWVVHHRWRRTEGWLEKHDLLQAGAALAQFNKMIRENPKDSRAYFARAMVVRYSFSSFPNDIDILRDLNEALRLDPEFALAYVERGLLNYLRRAFGAAIADFDEVIRLRPEIGMPYYNRALCRMQLREYEKAVADCDRAIHLMPTEAEFYRSRAEALVRIGNYDKALADVREARRLNANVDMGYLEIEALLGTDEYDTAISRLTTSIQEQSKGSICYAYRGYALVCRGRYADAAADYEKALPNAGKNTFVYNQCAWFLATCPEARFRNGKKAIHIANLACILTGLEDPDHFDIVAAASAGLHNFSDAWIREGWNEWRCLDVLAAAYAESKRFEEAIKWERRAIEVARERERGQLRSRLKLYKAGKPYRMSMCPASVGN